MSSGDDDEEIGAECPYYGPQCGETLTEVEGAEQDVETEHRGKDVPHIVREPQVVSLLHEGHRLGRIVRRCNLVSRHAAKETCCPSRGIAIVSIAVLVYFHIDTIVCTAIMLFESIALAHRSSEIDKGDDCKESNAQRIR